MTIAVDYTGTLIKKRKKICKYDTEDNPCEQAYNPQMRENFCEKNPKGCKIYSDLEEMELLEGLN